MGDEADDGGACQDARITQGGNGRHGDAFGHDRLLADCGVQHRHNVRATGTQQRITHQRRFPARCERRQKQTCGGGQPAGHNHPRRAQPPYDFVTGQTPGRHGQGKRRITEPRIRCVDATFLCQEHRAPVQRRAFGEEHDEAHAANEQDDAMGHRKRRPRTLAAVGQQMRHGLGQRDQQQHDHHQRGSQG
ncbi:hypothetical protein D3C76_1229730 [compost metagenome]